MISLLKPESLTKLEHLINFHWFSENLNSNKIFNFSSVVERNLCVFLINLSVLEVVSQTQVELRINLAHILLNFEIAFTVLTFKIFSSPMILPFL